MADVALEAGVIGCNTPIIACVALGVTTDFTDFNDAERP
jgi:hypothetical protein